MLFLENTKTLCENDGLKTIFAFINNVLRLIKIFIPILLIVMGSLDLGKAVVAGDEKEVKAAQGMLVKRALYAVAVFFVATIVPMLIGLVADPETKKCLKDALEAYDNTNNSITIIS
jgi:hypothetical protein